MSISKHVVQRPGSTMCYFRKMVPKDLRAVLGKREFLQSLRTSNRKDALEAAPALLALAIEEIKAARRRREPTADDLSRAVREFARRELQIDLQARRNYPTAADHDRERNRIYEEVHEAVAQQEALSDLEMRGRAPDRDQQSRHSYEAELRRHLARGETALLRWAADEIIARHAFVLSPEADRTLCHDLMTAHLDVLQILRNRDDGNFRDDGQTEAGEGKASPLIKDAFKLYAADAVELISRHTVGQYEKFIDLFEQFIGQPASLAAMTKANIRDWKLALEKWPVKATEKKIFRGKTFREILEQAAPMELKTITKRTIEKHVRALGAFSTWLVAQDYIDRNPTHGLVIGTKRPTTPVRSFRPEELKSLFNSPVYAGCKSEDVDWRPGSVKIRDWRFWLPLMSLFSGARLGELAQLMVADLKQSHGQWIFHLTEEGDGEKTLKTSGSQRVVPVHSMLIRLGILEHLTMVKKAGSVRLFPDLRPDSRGHFSRFPSRWFGRYLRRVKIKASREINFHSFRHTAADAFRSGHVSNDQFAPLFGHARATMTGRYGIEAEGTIEQRVAMIEAISYDLDLSHLMPVGAPAAA